MLKAHPHVGWPMTAALLLGACSRPPYVVVRVEDPEGVAAKATQLFAGTELSELEPVELNRKLSFPIQFTLSAAERGEREIVVAARSAEGTDLARGTETAILKRQGTPTVTVFLFQVCERDEDCFDELFCDGTGLCRDGLCEYEDKPCASNFPCVTSTCMEEAKACNVTVDHTMCADGDYCSPSVGCAPGLPCLDDGDCDDAFECNGVETCDEFHCLAGLPPDVNDHDPCTLDGCDDNRVEQGLEAIFNIPQVTLDGVLCSPEGEEPRKICVAEKGGCSDSVCGDAVVDEDRGEVCDEGDGNNSDDYSLDPTCKTDCTGWAPYCGDGAANGVAEVCDEGTANGSGTGCTVTCTRDGSCGDGLIQTVYESCDDQNADNCDGCRDDCQSGCICATGQGCDAAGEWCNGGVCSACDVPDHCGTACEVCSRETPLCGGVTPGCICSSGSCYHGWQCVSGVCEPCASDSQCGPRCEVCAAPTPTCAGPEAGCVAANCSGMPDSTPCRVVTSPDRSYDVCVGGVCVSPGCGDSSCTAPAPYFSVPDTNQRKCYDYFSEQPCSGMATCNTTSYCGQDAQYGWDTAHAEVDRLTRTEAVAGEPVVRDNVTGLMWQGCVWGKYGSTCENGTAAGWGQPQAVAYCDGLRWGGYADWHLPDLFEMVSLHDWSRSDPSVDASLFPGTGSAYHWTATTYFGGSAGAAWETSFFDGNTWWDHGSEALFVRCVRIDTPLAQRPAVRFERREDVAGEPVVIDNVRSVVWQGCPAGRSGSTCSGTVGTYTWEEALHYCEDLTWDNHSDWRLPNIETLHSLVDPRTENPAIDPLFPGTPINPPFWSSTTCLVDLWQAQRVGFFSGFLGGDLKQLCEYLVRCVRDNL